MPWYWCRQYCCTRIYLLCKCFKDNMNAVYVCNKNTKCPLMTAVSTTTVFSHYIILWGSCDTQTPTPPPPPAPATFVRIVILCQCVTESLYDGSVNSFSHELALLMFYWKSIWRQCQQFQSRVGSANVLLKDCMTAVSTVSVTSYSKRLF